MAWHECLSLIDRSKADGDAGTSGVDPPEWRAAGVAEVLIAWPAAVADLAVSTRRAGQDAEITWFNTDADPVRTTGEPLAIGTMAYADVLWIDLGFIADSAAMAVACDVHAQSPKKENPAEGGRRARGNLTVKALRLRG